MSAPGDNLSNFSMLELFRMEVETQKVVLNDGLVKIERDPSNPAELESLMRAAHSLKGAARIVGLTPAVSVAHAMEDGFVAAQKNKVILGRHQIDTMFQGVDLLARIANTPEADIQQWSAHKASEIENFLEQLKKSLAAPAVSAPKPVEPPVPVTEKTEDTAVIAKEKHERFLRVTSGNLNRLLGLASESLVESRRLRPFAENLLRLKRQQNDLSRMLDDLRDCLDTTDETTRRRLIRAQAKVAETRYFLAERLEELEMFDRRSTNLARRLYSETLSCRMRPFADGVQGFQRLVRDLSRKLNKEVRLEIAGQETQVDREILEQLEAPLTHILGNAVDHGLETPEQRLSAGKPAEATVKLEARHSAGVLLITVADDGRGIDVKNIRESIVRKKLATEDMAAQMSKAELMEFLFLPGFSTRENVTDVSGRGVGLDIVRNMARNVRGTVRVFSQLGKGTRFQFQLPLTLSVVRSLLVNIGGEPYAFPLAGIHRTLKQPRGQIQVLEGKQHFQLDGRQIGLVTARQILGYSPAPTPGDEQAVVIMGEKDSLCGLVVDNFIGEQELVVQPLDPRLGKIKDISAGALMENGSPVLIIDPEDLLRSIEKLAEGGMLAGIQETTGVQAKKGKRVLIVEDSLTVREVERKLLEAQGYQVEIAVDGMDGWNAVRTNPYDLVVSDVDMPRMDGIELVQNIRKDDRLKSIPVLILTYKEREEDRRRGLEAGADAYLVKGSFHDDILIKAVTDLIGKAHA